MRKKRIATWQEQKNGLFVLFLSKIGHVFVKASARKHSLDGLQVFAAKPDSRVARPPLKRLLKTQMCFQVTDHHITLVGGFWT